MAEINLVTGKRGEAHVTAVDQRNMNAATLGNAEFVFENNEQFKLEVQSNNKVRIKSGDGFMQGAHFRINESEYADLDVENGVAGYKRNDLVVARYSKDSISGKEKVDVVVLKGTPTDGTPSDPQVTTGDVMNGEALVNEMPLWRLPINGLTIGTPVKLFTVRQDMNVIREDVERLKKNTLTNLLKAEFGSATANGVTITANGDGTYVVNGTATARIDIAVGPLTALKPGEYSLNNDKNGARNVYCNYYNGSSWITLSSYSDGSRKKITITQHDLDTAQSDIYVKFYIGKDEVFNNDTFKPMVSSDLTATYDDFVEYSGDGEINENLVNVKKISEGVHTNLIPNGYQEATPAGLTIERLADDSYLVNGTATASGFIVVYRGAQTLNKIVEPNKRYILTNCSPVPSRVSLHLHMRKAANSNVRTAIVTNGNISTMFNTFGMSSDWNSSIVFYDIPNGTSFNNVVLKPMITEDLTAEKDYVPYSGAGRLNENLAAIFDMFHPIGYTFAMDNTDFNPNTAPGWHGVWERLTDCVIYAASDNVTGGIGAIVGSNTHTLTVSELPSHDHSIPKLSGTATGGNHHHISDGNYNVGAGSGGTAAAGKWGGASAGSVPTQNSGNLTMSVTTNASTTGTSGSGSAIDIRPRRLNSVVWRRIS